MEHARSFLRAHVQLLAVAEGTYSKEELITVGAFSAVRHDRRTNLTGSDRKFFKSGDWTGHGRSYLSRPIARLKKTGRLLREIVPSMQREVAYALASRHRQLWELSGHWHAIVLRPDSSEGGMVAASGRVRTVKNSVWTRPDGASIPSCEVLHRCTSHLRCIAVLTTAA